MQFIISLVIIYLHKNEINEHFKQFKSLHCLKSQLTPLHLVFNMSTFCHHTSLILTASLVTHSPRSTTLMLALSCPRSMQPRQQFVQSGSLPFFSRKL